MRLDYKQARSTIRRLKLGDTRAVEQAIDFLDADVYAFGSGYIKEAIWHYLRRVNLTLGQKQRLQRVGLKYLGRRMTREFSYMCRFMSENQDEEFRSEVERMSRSAETGVRRRARLLNEYLHSREEGEKMQRGVRYRVRSAA
jgi:hypothetical protein